MITRTELLAYIDETLMPGRFKDYCPNGLQVAGNEEIQHVVSGVTASAALLHEAIAAGADTVLVHHGYFWRGEDPCVVGMKQQRLKLLLENNINLIAYHLPLDAHPQLGNNVQLAEKLGILTAGEIAGSGDPAIALYGTLPEPVSLGTLGKQLEQKLGRTPLLIPGHDRKIASIGWCTGAAQGFLQQAAAMGLDAFVSGEISEPTTHMARELGIDYIAAGHHATERYGVQALGELLAQQFNLRHHFIDIDNPV
jgi:dinuclear metal center YbgI/SA1388 family protein